MARDLCERCYWGLSVADSRTYAANAKRNAAGPTMVVTLEGPRPQMLPTACDERCDGKSRCEDYAPMVEA